MKTSFYEKVHKALKIAFSGGVNELAKTLFKFTRYYLKDQWNFVYFELPINSVPFSFSNIQKPIVIRPAVRDDISRIESDIYPFLDGYGENDKRDISQIGEKGFWCFIAEKDDKLIHYLLVFEKALESPLMNTPFNKTGISTRDAYLGSGFTVPQQRGMWVLPYSLSIIFEYLKNNTDATRALLLVHKNTPGATDFYKRLGFKIIKNSTPKGPLQWVVKKIMV